MAFKGHRIEGEDKVRGRARYVDDLRYPETGMDPLFAVVATAPNGSGRVKCVNRDSAMSVAGVRCVVDHLNAPRLRKAKMLMSMCEPGTVVPLQSDEILYAGQAVALVVAETLQAAKDGLAALSIEYEEGSPPLVDMATGSGRLAPAKRAGIAPGVSTKGDIDEAMNAAAVESVETHHAPHHQNPIEPGAVMARWDEDGGLTVHAAVQWHHLDTTMIGQAFGLGLGAGALGLAGKMIFKQRGRSKVRLTNHLSGGAFGRNISYLSLLLAPIAAKIANAPVKLVQSRRDTYSLMSHRSEVVQRARISADKDGRLKGYDLEADIVRGHAAFVEPIGEMPFQLYDHEAHRLRTNVAPLDLPGSGWMRGPGVCHAIFTLEQGMDALAARLNMDPLDLRLASHADEHPVSGKPWEAKALKEAYEAGANAFGWRDRHTQSRMRPDGRLRGFGMASAIDMGRQFPATAHVTLSKLGATISCAAAEMGQGLLTGLTTISAEMLGLPPDKIRLGRMETSEGYAAGSIGSTGTYSNGAAVQIAVDKIRARLAKIATKSGGALADAAPNECVFKQGALVSSDGRSVSLKALLDQTGPVAASGRAGLDFGMREPKAKASFGAVFCEMAVDPLTLEVDIVRLVGAYDCGRMIRPAIVRAQLRGAMIMAMGQALMEETRLDRRTGHWTNAEIGEALVPTQADCPSVEVIPIGKQGQGPLDFKGIAETAMVGVAPAIASAFADATGGVIRSIPMTYKERLRAAGHLTLQTRKEAAE